LTNVVGLGSLWGQLNHLRPDIIYSNSSVIPLGAFLSKLYKIPHVWHIREFGEADYNLRHDWGETYFRHWLNQAAAVIAISRSVKSKVLHNLTAPVHTVYNGVISEAKNAAIQNRLRPFSRKPDFTFVLVGQINKNKGQKEAILALARLTKDYPLIKLRIVGDDTNEYAEDLKTLCRSLGLKDQVEFTGYVSDPFEMFLTADAALMCSRHEAMGRVTAEAMIAAKPVIAYNNAGSAEIVQPEKTGLLYEGADAELAEQMKRLVDNQEWAHQLGRAGREEASRHYVTERYAKHIYEILKPIVSSSKTF
jgi:glycosyltransferase involved in cell wall biosynthesis